MSEEIQALREEIAQLRSELNELREIVAPLSKDAHPAMHTVRAIRVRDGEGRGQVKITATEHGPGIYLYDGQGRCRGLFEIREKGANLELRGEDGEVLVSLKPVDGHGQVLTAAPDGTPRAAIRSTKHGGVVKVMNARGRALGYLLGSDKGGELELLNSTHRPCLSAFAHVEGGMIRLHEGSGEVMASLSGNGESGLLTVFGNLGEQAVTLCAAEDGGHVLVCDNDGTVMIDIGDHSEPPTSESAPED